MHNSVLRQFLKLQIVVILFILSMTLVACQPGFPIGLEAISPDGRWATIVEYSGDPPRFRLFQLDLEGGESVLLAESEIEGVSVGSSFSSESLYALIRIPQNGWFLKKTDTDEQNKVAEDYETSQFLPGGKLLIVSRVENLHDIYTINPEQPEHRNLRAKNIQYIFSNQGSIIELEFGSLEILSNCNLQRFSNRVVWTMLDDNDAVFVLLADPEGVSINEVTNELSSGIKSLLERQRAADKALFSTFEPDVMDIVRTQAEERGEILTEEQINDRFEEKMRVLEHQYVFTSVTGIPSPDGTKLLFLRVEEGEDEKTLFTLYLIDLKSDNEPFVLSTETEWQPGFSFSPDGNQILFESNRDGGRAGFLADVNGENIIRLIEQDASNFCWY